MRRSLFLIFALLTLSACGRKGALMPPEALVPAAVQNLKVQQSGEELRISWSAPSKEKGGRPLRDLAGFNLFKRIIAGDGTDCSACPESWQLLAAVDSDNPGETLKSGSTFIRYERNIPPGQTNQYRLLVLSKSGGFSSPATSPLVKFQSSVPAPGLKGAVLPASVKLEFTFVPPADAELAGFNVYRRTDKTAAALLPLNPAPLPGSVWEDTGVEFDRSYLYSATALVVVNGESVESGRSEEIDVLFKLQELR
jgi:predicted small lipoprotein YifL